MTTLKKMNTREVNSLLLDLELQGHSREVVLDFIDNSGVVIFQPRIRSTKGTLWRLTALLFYPLVLVYKVWSPFRWILFGEKETGRGKFHNFLDKWEDKLGV